MSTLVVLLFQFALFSYQVVNWTISLSYFFSFSSLRNQTSYYYYYYYSLIRAFHISVNRWFFTGVWVTVSLLNSRTLLSIWPFSLMLSFGWSPLVRQIPSPLVSFYYYYYYYCSSRSSSSRSSSSCLAWFLIWHSCFNLCQSQKWQTHLFWEDCLRHTHTHTHTHTHIYIRYSSIQ